MGSSEVSSALSASQTLIARARLGRTVVFPFEGDGLIAVLSGYAVEYFAEQSELKYSEGLQLWRQ